jgi:toxin CptA
MAVLSVHRKPSYRLAAILSIAHLATSGLLGLLALPLSIRVIIVAILIISLIHYLRQDALLIASNAVVAFVLSDEMQCTVTTYSGKSMIYAVMSSTFVTPYLTVLSLKSTEKFFAHSVVILPDSIDAEEFRQLRVWLRWRRRQGETD